MYPVRYNNSNVSSRLIRPFPSANGCMQRKSRMNNGISNKSSYVPLSCAVRKASQSRCRA